MAKLRARLVTAFAMLGDDRLRHVALHAVVALAEVANKKAGIGTVGEVERLQERTGAR